MKTTINLLAIILVAGTIVSCSNVDGETTNTTGVNDVKMTNYDQVMALDNDRSILEWEGYKPTGQHNGTVEIASGELMMKDGQLVGGSFTFDMNSITVLDLTNPEWNAKLTNHLKSADFFEVEMYPKAAFEATEVKPVDGSTADISGEKGKLMPTHAITGNLTIKGISKGITIYANVDASEDRIMAESNMFFLDRTEWNVQYKSKKIFAGLKDDFINDEMGIRFNIVATSSDNDLASK